MRNWNAAYGNTKVFCIYCVVRYLPYLTDIRKTSNLKSTIKPLIRPGGEAGNRKRGFNLYEAMEMNNVENGPVVYDRMRVSEECFCTLKNVTTGTLEFCSSGLHQSGLGFRRAF